MNEQRDAEAILAELQGQARRQAVPSITGTVYQAWCSIDSWLQLTEADQVIFLEGAEDFDVVTTQGAVAVQVRHTDASISLGTSKAKEAVKQFWALAQRESRRRVDYHYLTTSPISHERDADFGGLSGVEAWRIASTSEDVAASVGRYLSQHLDVQSSLGQFLASAEPRAVQERLFQRFHWMTDQPDMEAVKRSVDERICVLLHTQRRSIALAQDVRNRLEGHFWTVITRPASNERRLTFGELLQLVEAATTTLLPIPTDRFVDLLGVLRPGAGLLRLLKDKVPAPPSPLITRQELVGRIEEMIRQRRSVLLTGTVFKGKTTVAQLVAGSICPDAWWMNVSGRSIDQVDSLLLALAGEIDSGACPAVVVIDDLDIGPSAHRAYRDSLAMVLHRAKASGRALLISAQGGATDDGSAEGWKGFEIVPIPEIAPTEVSALCVREGCLEEDAGFWGAAVYALSAGHPKLVQVRIAELSEQRWPKPTAAYIAAASAATESVRLTARRLLNEAWQPEVVELLYCLSECTIALHRGVAIKLAELVGGVRNPGDVLDRLTGKWIDCVEGEWFRTTPLLSGVASAVWSPEKRALAHVRIHDAIFAKRPFSPAEAAALVYHAFLASEPYRLAMACMQLRVLEDDGAREAVERNLLWLPFVALEPGQRPAVDAVAGSAFRMLQFSVGVTVDADTLPRIAQRWIEEAAIVPHPEMSLGMKAMMLVTFAIADTRKLPLRIRLDAISELSRLDMKGDVGSEIAAGLASSLVKSLEHEEGLPASATQIQALLALCNRWVSDAGTLEELIDWLDSGAADEIRSDFDRILEWPLVQALGAFVQSAWASNWDQATDWSAWITRLDNVYAYAKRRTSPNLAAEAAKAKAVVLTEYLSRPNDALEAIDLAEREFGRSAVLDEQRVNVLFQGGNDTKVIELWEKFVADNEVTIDPFAYRRVAISAARLHMWTLAERNFRKAADVAKGMPNSWSRVGLLADCALVVSLEGGQRRAAATLVEALNSLPASAAEEDAHGEAVQRIMSEIGRRIENALYKPSDAEPKIEPGRASSPSLEVPRIASGQSLRTALTTAQVVKLAACFGIPVPILNVPSLESADALSRGMVHWVMTEARLAMAIAQDASATFIPTFVDFLAATVTLGRMRASEIGQGVTPTDNDLADCGQWLGHIVAAVCCSGALLADHLLQWLSIVRAMVSPPNNLESLILQIQAGANIERRAELWSVVADSNANTGTRCGAAAKLMLKGLAPTELLQIQAWLTSAMMGGASGACQELFAFSVGKRFAGLWESVTANPFQLRTPRVTVPNIKANIAEVVDGRVTLRTFLLQMSRILNQPLGDFVPHVR